jgi:ribose-phosphate pyrophosphokinase
MPARTAARVRRRVPISAKVVANLLETVGVERVLTMDLHADQIQGFFDIPVDNIYASPVLLGDLRAEELRRPDRGVARRRRRGARPCAGQAAELRPGHHRQAPPEGQRVEVMHVIGEIDGRNCVIMDDMIDTAGTLVKAAEVLKERGAKNVYAYCTHPIFSGPAIERIAKGDALDEVVVTNTIPLSRCGPAAERSASSPWPADRRNDPAHRQGRVGDEFVLGPGQPVLI